MLIKLLLLFLIIFIALFLIIFSELVHISVNINFTEDIKNGYVEAKYYCIKIIKSFVEGYLKINFDTRFFSKNLKTIYPDDDEKNNPDYIQESTGDTYRNDDNESYENDNQDTPDNSTNVVPVIKKYYSEIWDVKEDLLDILLSLRKIIFLGENHINIAFGLNDNNLTIKISSFLWAIFAPFYAMGLRVVITPLMDETRLDLNVRLDFELSLLMILRIVFKVIANVKLVKLIINLYKELN